MPFAQYFPRSLSANGINAHAPSSPGVYGYSNSREGVYPGQTDNLRAELHQHLFDSASPESGRGPTGDPLESGAEKQYPVRLERLILEHAPGHRQGQRDIDDSALTGGPRAA